MMTVLGPKPDLLKSCALQQNRIIKYINIKTFQQQQEETKAPCNSKFCTQKVQKNKLDGVLAQTTCRSSSFGWSTRIPNWIFNNANATLGYFFNRINTFDPTSSSCIFISFNKFFFLEHVLAVFAIPSTLRDSLRDAFCSLANFQTLN